MIEIKEIKSKKELKTFATYPTKLYKDCPYYVPSLRSDELNTFNPKKNFNLRGNKYKAFLCYKDGELVGRIAGLINKKDTDENGNAMIRFSRFDCINDIEVFKALLLAVENFGKENGISYIHGPWGFNDTDREGMLTFGFNERSTYATNYYYDYFAKNMKELGYEDESIWQELRFVIPEKVDDRIVSIAERYIKRGDFIDVTDTMPFNKIVKKYANKFFDTYNLAYAHLDGFIPVDESVQKNVLQQFVVLLDKRYCCILVDKNDNVAAFGIVLASIADALIKNRGKLFPFGFIDVLKAKKDPKDLEMALIAVRPEYKNTGINAIIITKILNNIIKNKVTNLESNPMLVTNLAIKQQWGHFETDVIKKRQTYKKKL